jgi:hypothetical protein
LAGEQHLEWLRSSSYIAWNRSHTTLPQLLAENYALVSASQEQCTIGRLADALA